MEEADDGFEEVFRITLRHGPPKHDGPFEASTGASKASLWSRRLQRSRICH